MTPDDMPRPAEEFTGREPELPSARMDDAPMLGGERALWPSVAVYLLNRQHIAHRAGDMERVWVLRRLRHRLQQTNDHRRYQTVLDGKPYVPITDAEALAIIRRERKEVSEAREQCRQFRRGKRAAELGRALAVIDEVITYWQPRVEAEAGG